MPAEELSCHGKNPAAYSPAARLEVHHGPLIYAQSNGQLPLRQPEAATLAPEPVGERPGLLLRVVAEKPNDAAELPRQRIRPPGFPRADGLLANAELPGKGSLRQSEVEPAAPEVVTHGAETSRVTPWQGSRSGRHEPQAGKRQRNGAPAAGSGTPSAAAAAPPPSTRSSPRG